MYVCVCVNICLCLMSMWARVLNMCNMAFIWHENGKNDVWMLNSGGDGKHPFSTTLRCLFEEKLFAISKLNYSKILSMLSLSLLLCACVCLCRSSTWPCAQFSFSFSLAVYMYAFLVIRLFSICWHRWCRYFFFFIVAVAIFLYPVCPHLLCIASKWMSAVTRAICSFIVFYLK